MNVWQIILSVLCGLSLIQCLFLSVVLLTKDKLKFQALFYFALMLLGLALRLIKSYFVFIPQDYPNWGIVLGGAGLWMIGPSFYFYTKLVSGIEEKSKWLNAVHYLPSITILILGQTNFVYYIGLFHLGVYYAFAVYDILSIKSVRKPKHLVSFAVCVGAILGFLAFQALGTSLQMYTIGVGLSIGVLYVINFLITKESSFFNSNGVRNKNGKSKSSEEVLKALEKVFMERRIYRTKGLTVAMVALELDCPAYLISQSINHHRGLRFNDFVNRFRVEEVRERLIQTNDKVEVIAKETGFSSVSSLYDAFRKNFNTTPQGFREQQQSVENALK